MDSPFIWIGLVVLLLGGVIVHYNALVRLRQHCRESWADIDTELKRRYDLIPNLVNTVKAYAAHERETLDSVVVARSRAVSSTGTPETQARDENLLVAALQRLLMISEDYPDLKANENFLELQNELTRTEDRIQAARRFYNGNVREMNTRVEVLPSNLIAMMFGFQHEEFFEIESAAERRAPAVKLDGT